MRFCRCQILSFSVGASRRGPLGAGEAAELLACEAAGAREDAGAARRRGPALALAVVRRIPFGTQTAQLPLPLESGRALDGEGVGVGPF